MSSDQREKPEQRSTSAFNKLPICQCNITFVGLKAPQQRCRESFSDGVCVIRISTTPSIAHSTMYVVLLLTATATVNPLMGTLKPQSTFGTARRGLDGYGPTQAPPHCTECNSPPINGQCTNFILFRSFDVAGPRLWNKLPASLQSSDSLCQFRRHFKMFVCQGLGCGTIITTVL